MKHTKTHCKQVFKPVRKPSFTPRPTRRCPVAIWKVSATIGEHNNIELTVPAENIMVAGLVADKLISNAAFAINSSRRDFQTQSITQVV